MISNLSEETTICSVQHKNPSRITKVAPHLKRCASDKSRRRHLGGFGLRNRPIPYESVTMLPQEIDTNFTLVSICIVVGV